MRVLDTLCMLLAVVSGSILLVLIGLTFTDVVLRYVFAAPILGAGDVLQIGMVLVIALAIPFTWRAGGHIVMDLVPDYGLELLTRLRSPLRLLHRFRGHHRAGRPAGDGALRL